MIGKSRLTCALAAIVFGLVTGSPALAGVIEVMPDGSVKRLEAPGVTTDQGWASLDMPAPIGALAADIPADVARTITEASSLYELSPHLVAAVAWQESRFRQSAVSPKGAAGVMQLMPATARQLGVDSRDMRQNIHGGSAYLAAMLNRYGGNLTLALAAYNAGPGAVDRYGGVPPYAETRAYVAGVLRRLAATAGTQH